MARSSRQLIQTALHETLDSVVSPAVRSDVLAAALTEVEGGALPGDVHGFRQFIHGPLKAALVRVLGRSLAEAVTADLEQMGCSIPPSTWSSAGPRSNATQPVPGPVVPPNPVPRSLSPTSRRTATGPGGRRRSAPPGPRRTFSPRSGTAAVHGASRSPGPVTVRDRRGPSPNDPPVAAAAEDRTATLALVVVATRSLALVAALAARLAGVAEVRVVADVLDLADELMAPRRVLLVVDCKRPSVRPVAVAALADELPPTAAVLLWVPSADDEVAVRTVAPEATAWHRCAEATAVELARRCAELVQ